MPKRPTKPARRSSIAMITAGACEAHILEKKAHNGDALARFAEDLRREIIEAAACETLLKAHRRAVLRQDETEQDKLSVKMRRQTTKLALAEHRRIEIQTMLGRSEMEILGSMPPFLRPMFEALFDEKRRLKIAMQDGARRNRILFSRLKASGMTKTESRTNA